MKKYIVFILSFALLYGALHILSGWILTAFYTLDISLPQMNLSQETSFGQTSAIPFFATLTIATLAYFMSQKLLLTSEK